MWRQKVAFLYPREVAWSWLLVRGAGALVLSVAIGSSPGLASTVVVPDDFSTIQSAVDSGADTVLIREGTYPERPVVDRPVVLQGIGIGQRPRLDGLTITNQNFLYFPPPDVVSVSRINFTGRIEHATVATHPQGLIFSFSACSLEAGFYQVQSLDPHDVGILTIRNSYLGGESRARMDQIVMEADTVLGGSLGMSWSVEGTSIEHCVFRGGGLELTGTPRGRVAFNRIENSYVGLTIQDSDMTVESNTIVGCETGMFVWGDRTDVFDNNISRCGIGVYAGLGGDVHIMGNRIVRSRDQGLLTDGVLHLLVDHNVVLDCGGAGMQIGYTYFDVTVRNNTVVGNGGSGITVNQQPLYGSILERNIGCGNLGWGLKVTPGAVVDLGCNDWFGNALGSVSGVSAGSSDLSVDPLFCDVDGADVRLASASPLLGVSGCGQIGALGVGCGETATLVQRFTAERVSDGIRIVWEVAEGATASEVWVERSEGVDAGPWIRPLAERSFENRAVVELDGSAVSDRAYWYRLVAVEGNDATVIGPPIVVEAQARLEFRLVQVGPNPGSGPVKIAFALKHAAAIEIDVFDVQGRRVASPGRGVWPAGTHMVEWNGLTRNGEAAPSGLYLLRYAYPGGQDRRRLVRIP